MSVLIFPARGYALVSGRRVPNDPEAIAQALRETMPPVSRFQARTALRRAGLFEAAEAAATMAGGEVLDAWNEALEWARSSPTLAALAGALGLTEEQVDDLFQAAAEVEL